MARCAFVLGIAAVFFSSVGYAAEPAEDASKAATEAVAKAKSSAATRNPRDDEYYELYKAFADAMDQVERNYVKDVSRRELMEAAIRGMLSKLDPYSNYINPDELGRFKTSVENQFGGIGIQIDVQNGELTIVTPLVGSPAYRAGLQAGDRIVEIEGKSTEGIKTDEAVKLLKGEVGTKVTIAIKRDGQPKREVTIERDIVEIETVMGDRRKDDDTWEFMLDPDKRLGYIRVTAFGRDTASDLEAAIKQLKQRNLRGLILDLRFNPGGLLTSAVEVADLFVSEGRIVSTSGRNSPDRVWEARKEGTYSDFPMVVLVNRYSASASEIVAACLQDHKRAVIVGERTWGKGSVQNVIELEGGKSALKLTTAGYLRPNGHNIDRRPGAKEADEWGVMPDKGFEIKLSREEMERLAEVRRKRDLLLVNHYQADGDAKKDEAPTDAEPSESSPAPQTAPMEEAKEVDAGEEKSTETAKAEPKSETAVDDEFVDPQLQKAIDYLAAEIARADVAE